MHNGGSMEELLDIVNRSKRGDHDAFANLYDRFAPLVRAITFDTTGSLPESEDLCQEIFFQTYQRLAQLRDNSRFPGWLLKITRHACQDWQRSKRRRRQFIATDMKMSEAIADHSAQTSQSDNEEIRRLREAIRQLPPKERMALHLFYLAEQPASLARETIGLSNSGFYKTLDRAKKHVAAILQKNEVIS
jgi:RNA polymerase sigma-70 factor, ECF subfamily